MQEETRAWTKAGLFERQNGEIQYGQSGVGGAEKGPQTHPKGQRSRGPGSRGGLLPLEPFQHPHPPPQGSQCLKGRI